MQFSNQRFAHLDDHNYHINSGQKPYKSVLRHSVVSTVTERCYESTSCKRFSTYTRDDSCITENLFAENQYNGNICHKRSKNINDVKGHTKVHDGRKPYKCEQCNKVFARSETLTFHLRNHTGEKPYKCHLCHKAFVGRAVKRHIRTHYGEKPYKCERCNKVFSRSETLKFHLRIHTGEKPYNCHLCHKAFVAKDVLKRHIRTHTGEKPYKCNVCHKVFAERSTVRKHSEIHNRKKSYKCEFCNITFTHLSDLNFHLATHYGKKSNKSELFQAVVRRMTKTYHDHTSSKRFTMYAGDDSYFDEKELPTTMKPKVFSSVQCINSSPLEHLFSGHQSIIAADINPFVVRTYGCALCNGMFEIKKEFIKHCYNHSDIPRKDTLFDLFEDNSC